MGEDATSGAVFLTAEYTILNVSRQALPLFGVDVTLIGSDGATFTRSQEAEGARGMSDANRQVGDDLQPGVARETFAIFEVPERVTDRRFRLIFREPGCVARSHVLETTLDPLLGVR